MKEILLDGPIGIRDFMRPTILCARCDEPAGWRAFVSEPCRGILLIIRHHGHRQEVFLGELAILMNEVAFPTHAFGDERNPRKQPLSMLWGRRRRRQ